MSDTGIKQFNASSNTGHAAGVWALWSDLTVSGSDGAPMVLALQDTWSVSDASSNAGHAAPAGGAPKDVVATTVAASASAGGSGAAPADPDADAADAATRAMLNFALGLADPGADAAAPATPATSTKPADVAQTADASVPTPALDPNSEEACAKAFEAAMAAALAADGMAAHSDTGASVPVSHAV
jgi:hypothetical protein